MIPEGNPWLRCGNVKVREPDKDTGKVKSTAPEEVPSDDNQFLLFVFCCMRLATQLAPPPPPEEYATGFAAGYGGWI